MNRLAILLVVIGCGGASETQHEQVATLSFDVPANWTRSDFHQRGGQIAQWAPEQNKRHESVTIVRTELSPQIATADESYLASLLVQAQLSLAKSNVSSVQHVSTKHGIVGVRLSVDFVPPGSTEVYHRVHVLLVENRALVNVIYTAREPSTDALALMLDTLRHEEG